jgi:hypothetical protein
MSARRVIWGAIVLVLGILLLAANFGWIDWTFVLSLWRLWPLILVLIGVGLLFRDRNQTLGAVIMLLIVLAGVGIAWLSYNGLGWGSVKTTDIVSPAVTGATSGRAEINIGASRLSIAGGDSASVSGTATSRRAPEVTFQQPVNGEFRFTVSQEWQNFAGFDTGRRESLDLRLPTGLPWTIAVHSGAADMDIDLSRVWLSAFELSTGASSLKLRVGPVVAPNARVDISGGAASYELWLPRSLNISVRTQTGLTSLQFDPDFTKSGDLWLWNGGGTTVLVEVKSGVSSLRVHLY